MLCKGPWLFKQADGTTNACTLLGQFNTMRLLFWPPSIHTVFVLPSPTTGCSACAVVAFSNSNASGRHTRNRMHGACRDVAFLLKLL